jgi:hypothetical protein
MRTLFLALALGASSCAAPLVLRVRCDGAVVLEADVELDAPATYPLPSGSCSATVERKEK